MCEERLNDWYETPCNMWLKEKGCMGKWYLCNDHEIFRKLPVKETVETPVTSSYLAVDCLELKTDRMSIKPLYIV
jgi:hypothetical protein